MSTTQTIQVPVKTISTQEVRQLLDNQRPIQFWNVLTDEWFKGENISGSRRVPLDKVGSEVRATNLPKDVEIVVYCGGPKCPQSRMAAEKYFWRNSVAAYHWVKRESGQPQSGD